VTVTPAVLAAQRAGIDFTLHEYAHDASAASYGLEAAEKLGVPAEQVFKTLVAKLDGARLAVAVVPVNRTLDLKALAAALGGKRAAMADVGEAERATGYVAGGISPLGQRKRLPTALDRSALACEKIDVSAGRRGLEIALAPADLLRLCGGTAADVAR
jgi:Cys-tRNA(Pro)/Cys-tRNA(Cys) deacylase